MSDAADPIARADRSGVLPVLIAAAVLRVLWMYGAQGLAPVGPEEAGEATRVAISVSLGKGLADAFPGLGPTAHMLPLPPLVAGGVIHLFGGAGAPAAVALTVWALVQVGVGYLLLDRLFRTIDMAPETRRAGLALLCLVPVFAPEETISFRYWEGALAVCIGTAALAFLFHLRRRATIRPRDLIVAAAILSAGAFVSPAVGLASGICWALFALTRLSPREILLFATATVLATALWAVPWTIRNIAVLDAPIVVRSNFGLELAIGNHAAAVAPADPAVTFRDRLQAVHPYHGLTPYRRARTMGEVGYAKAVGRAAETWIAANPVAFLTLCGRHYRQFFLPEPWQFAFSQSDVLPVARSVLMRLVAVAGIVSLMLGIWRRRFGYRTLAVYLAVVGMPYALVQPVPRYSYLIYGLFCYLAADLITNARRRVPPPGDRPVERACA
ncbi:hypothetical protein FSB78_06890 [Sphingomonas ginsenosidivorax]|uniref:Glycosyltransferase RgtA/B/C/D-like domain-containing protein n=1 Tax=Sphingomonas ginsenosidivorax TaxID=862135 RepID=A0A5C6UEP2_9SPHN|nr:hypothetical protein [Sphingomonas ginsenosidivorax]TXC70691.1 hypothetical protein FSB78_06890 [Sphingomonas ginsenosidivorax]